MVAGLKMIDCLPHAEIVKSGICARERGYENCAFCPEYICSNLKEFYDKDPSAKKNLDLIRNSNLLIIKNRNLNQ